MFTVILGIFSAEKDENQIADAWQCELDAALLLLLLLFVGYVKKEVSKQSDNVRLCSV